MILQSLYSDRSCRMCYRPLIELLSDAAGRIFGCKRCGILPVNCDRPALVTHVERLARRARRGLARRGFRGRRGARPIAATREETREPAERFMVLPIEAFRGQHLRDLGEGWALGILSLPNVAPVFRYYSQSTSTNSAAVLATVQSVTITLKQVGGLAWGWTDERCPDRIVLPAFERLFHERAHRVFPALLPMK